MLFTKQFEELIIYGKKPDFNSFTSQEELSKYLNELEEYTENSSHRTYEELHNSRSKFQNEPKKYIKGYEELYSVTESGRIYSHISDKYLSRNGNHYEFHTVKLYKNGRCSNHSVFDLWKDVYGHEFHSSKFKGSIKHNVLKTI